MRWRKGNAYFIRSVEEDGTDGPYTITRLFLGNTEKFEVWRLRLHVSTHTDAEEARASAEAHSLKFNAGLPVGVANGV